MELREGMCLAQGPIACQGQGSWWKHQLLDDRISWGWVRARLLSFPGTAGILIKNNKRQSRVRELQHVLNFMSKSQHQFASCKIITGFIKNMNS